MIRFDTPSNPGPSGAASDGPGVPRRDDPGLRADRAGARRSAARCSTASSRTTPRVQVALSMMNRHGLIAGATGTGKTKTLQLLAGQLSQAGVPVFVADIKGDVTGIAAPGDATNPKVIERAHVARPGRSSRPATRSSSCRCRASSARRSGRRSTLRAAAARQGPRPQRDADLDPLARLQVLRRQRPAAARPQGPRDDAEVPRRPTRASRSSPTTAGCRPASVGRPAALDRRPRAGGRRHLLRRARVRRR